MWESDEWRSETYDIATCFQGQTEQQQKQQQQQEQNNMYNNNNNNIMSTCREGQPPG